MKWILDLERIAPRLNVVDSGIGSFSVHPANYTDLANFVQEFVINDNTVDENGVFVNRNRVRELLDDTRYTQHPLNFRPLWYSQYPIDGDNTPTHNGVDGVYQGSHGIYKTLPI